MWEEGGSGVDRRPVAVSNDLLDVCAAISLSSPRVFAQALGEWRGGRLCGAQQADQTPHIERPANPAAWYACCRPPAMSASYAAFSAAASRVVSSPDALTSGCSNLICSM